MVARSTYFADEIRKDFIAGEKLSVKEFAKKLQCDEKTITNYRSVYKAIQERYPEKLHDFTFYLQIKRVKEEKYDLNRDYKLEEMFYELIDEFKSHYCITVDHIYPIYKSRVNYRYSKAIFGKRFNKWRLENNICKYRHMRLHNIPDKDLETLISWRSFASDSHRYKRALALLASYNGKTFKEIADFYDKPIDDIVDWFKEYWTGGINKLQRKKYTMGQAKVTEMQIKQDNLIKLLHHSPRIYNINRNTWRYEDLVTIYKQEYGQYICISTVAKHLKIRNYGFKKSIEKLTSHDPKFKEKIEHIKSILSNLASDEKFFSIDEYGHFAVKIKGGRSLMPKKTHKVVPQIQKSKGFMVVTAAIELSTNQVTHFYSKKKDSQEMIKLVNILSQQYKGNRNLYLSWDAAVWHRSKALKEHLDFVNSNDYREIHNTPIIKIAPLPTSAQFLNVIEAVFSGLAKSIIHNSDFESVEDCQASIDKYFEDRNVFFQNNPKKAGKMLWGKEKVKIKFDEANNCDYKK